MARSRSSVVRSIAVHSGGVPVRGRRAASASFVERVFDARQSRNLALPAKAKAARFADDLLELLFPHFSEDVYYSAAEIDGRLRLLLRNLKGVLQPLATLMPHGVAETAERFEATLPGVYESLLLDAAAINAGDPAAESLDEVISAYPGFLAIAIYRIAHEFYRLEVPIFPGFSRKAPTSEPASTSIRVHASARRSVSTTAPVSLSVRPRTSAMASRSTRASRWAR